MAGERKQRYGGCMVAVMAFLAVGSAFGALNPNAQTFYWTGAEDAYWTNANNWEMEDGSAAATAPGVVGDLPKPEEWVGHKLDTAIFDGARFKSLSPLALNVQGLLCVGYVTVQGATTPAISFGTSRGDAQCFPLYSSAVEPTDANGEPGVFTVAADVVNMPVIPYPGIGALFDSASGTYAFGRFVNNVAGRTFTLFGTRATVLDPSIASKKVSVHAAFAGPGDFSLGGTYAGKASCGVGASGQKFFDYYPSEGSSLVVTNCTETFARVYFKTSETCLHTVTIAKDSWLKANNIGFDQLVFCGSFHFVGEGWLGAQGSTKTSPFGLPLAGSTNRFDVPIYVGREYKYDRPSTDEVRFAMNKNGASALELNNPQNVFDGGIYVDGGDLTVGALDNETGSAIGDGKLTFLGRHVFKYTGDAAVMTNAIFAGQGGGQGGNETGIEFVHAGHGKLEVHGKIDFPSVNQQNRVLIKVPNADAELEFFQGIQDATTYPNNGLSCDITGAGRTILHGACSALHWFTFGNNSTRPQITLADDFSFSQHLGKGALNVKIADITVKGPDSGEMKMVEIFAPTTFYAGENHFRFTGRASLRFAAVDVKANFLAKIYRENADQQIYLPSATYRPSFGAVSWFRMQSLTSDALHGNAEFNLDGSARPWVSGLGTRFDGISANGGVIEDGLTGIQPISHDDTEATGPVTLAADEVRVDTLVQKGWPDTTIAVAAGQTLTVTNLIRSVEAGQLAIGATVGTGTLIISSTGCIRNEDGMRPIVINSALSPAGDKSVTVKGNGPIVINGPLVCGDKGITLDAPGGSNPVVTLTNPNSDYTGWTYVWRGTLKLGGENVIPPNSLIVIQEDGILDLNGHSVNLANIRPSGSKVRIINSSGLWTFAAGGTTDYSALPVSLAAGDVVTISNPERVLTRPRSRFVLARFKDDIANAPTLDPDVQQQLGPEWALIAEGADLVLRGPDRGMMLMIR